MLIIVSAVSIYLGSYLPFIKAKLYPEAAIMLNEIRGIEGFKILFTKVFETYSPVGQEEVVKFTSTIIQNTISREDVPEEPAIMIVKFIEPYFIEDNVRHLIMLGNMYGNLWTRFGKEEHFLTAEKYYLEAKNIGPKLPPVLYSILDLYRRKGDKEKILEIGNIILGYWPQDASVRALLQEVESQK